jgi:hypothetical protein
MRSSDVRPVPDHAAPVAGDGRVRRPIEGGRSPRALPPGMFDNRGPWDQQKLGRRFRRHLAENFASAGGASSATTPVPHFEGRCWRGLHHHVYLLTLAYGFPASEQPRAKEHPVGPTKKGKAPRITLPAIRPASQGLSSPKARSELRLLQSTCSLACSAYANPNRVTRIADCSRSEAPPRRSVDGPGGLASGRFSINDNRETPVTRLFRVR